MNYLTSAYTDIGIKKNTNQDSVAIKVANTEYGKVMFCILCDGMGGLSKGELASATIINAFSSWFINKFPEILYNGLNVEKLKNQWEEVIYFENQKLIKYGKSQGVNLGTTVACILIARDNYYILNIGDSRVYEITENLTQITKDQTVIAREVELGNMTEEQAKFDPQRNVLLQCVGASQFVVPDFFSGVAKINSVYMLCSDGFRHEISPDEIYAKFNPNSLFDEATMQNYSKELVELNKSRLENDNITVALIRTY